MKFYVIFSVDTCKGAWQGHIRKPTPHKAWDQTEGRESYEYSYLEGDWKGGNHRKWCGLLTREQFEAWLRDRCLYPEDCETMGSLTGFGWLPAISFNGDDTDAILNAYVTPIPEVGGKEVEGGSEKDWERARRAVIRYYKNF